MENQDSKAQPFSPATWRRGLFMLICAFLYNVAEIVVVAVAVLQFLFKLVTGEENSQLKLFGQGLSVFFYQTMQFLTFNSEEKPFPFTPWPSADSELPHPSRQSREKDGQGSPGGES